MGAKTSLINLMDYFADLPVELVQMSGLRHIVLDVTNPHPKPGSLTAAADADMSSRHNVIVINANGSINGWAYGHEMGHIMNAATCGTNGAANDPGYVNLNGGAGYNVKSRQPDINNEDGTDTIFNLQSQEAEAENANNTTLAAQLQAQIRAAQQNMTFVSRAGNLAEDVADMGSKTFNPFIGWVNVVKDEEPRLEAKFMYQLATIAQYNPRAAAYLTIVSRVYTHTPGSNPYITAMEGSWATVNMCGFITNADPALIPVANC